MLSQRAVCGQRPARILMSLLSCRGRSAAKKEEQAPAKPAKRTRWVNCIITLELLPACMSWALHCCQQHAKCI